LKNYKFNNVGSLESENESENENGNENENENENGNGNGNGNENEKINNSYLCCSVTFIGLSART